MVATVGAMTEPGVMEQWVIYDHPADHPHHFVVRRWFIGAGKVWPEPIVHRYTDLEAARDWVQERMPGAYRLDRQPDDDRTIVEVWL